MRKIKLFTLLAAAMFATSTWAETIGGPWTSGDCTVTIDDEGVMTVSGSGATAYYASASSQPWFNSLAKASVTKIVVEEGVTELKANAFASIANVETVELPNSLTTIGNYVFSNCHELWKVVLPANLSGTLGAHAFEGTAITSINIPSYVTKIGDYAFNNCAYLSTLGLPANLTEIGQYAFANCTNLEGIDLPTGVSLAIKNSAFEASGLTAIEIPANVTFLITTQYWFKNCASLSSVTLPSTWTSLPRNTFEGCAALTSITLPEALTEIPSGLFKDCANLASITIPSAVTRINSTVFSGCSGLTTITIPSSVVRIDANAFNGCSSLETMYFTSEAETPLSGLHTTSFANCSALKIYCPEVNGQAYANKLFTVNADYWDILYLTPSGEHAPAPHDEGFCGKDGGNNLTWETNSGTLTISGTGAMAEWDFLNSSVAPWNKYKPGITRIEIAEGVTSIGGSAFYNCDKVKTFIIPSTVTSIGADAFFSCDNPEVEVYCYADPNNLTWNDRNCDDFLSYSPGTGTVRSASYSPATLHIQETKCYVPSAYLAKYVEKWYTGSTDFFAGSDVNVFFAVGLNDVNDAAGINAILNDTHGKLCPIMTVTRPVKRDGYFNTFCFPFSMSSTQIANSAIASAVIKEFTGASVSGTNVLNLEFTETDHIEAGKPYFIKFDNAADLDRIDFLNVTIDKTAPTAVTHNGVSMIGTYVPKSVSVQTSATDGDGVLFLGPSNTLYWPSAAGNIKPFRAYFSVAGGAGAPIRRGMQARIVERENAPTAVDFINSNDVKLNKTIENGMLVIEKNGVRYNAQGQIVK